MSIKISYLMYYYFDAIEIPIIAIVFQKNNFRSPIKKQFFIKLLKLKSGN
jgi:hypothetical protein